MTDDHTHTPFEWFQKIYSYPGCSGWARLMTVRGWRSHVLFFQWARCIISRYPNNGLTSLGKLHKRMKMWVRLSKSCICLSLKHCCTRMLEKKRHFTSLWKNLYLEMWRILQDWDHKTYNLKKPELKPVKGLMSCSMAARWSVLCLYGGLETLKREDKITIIILWF